MERARGRGPLILVLLTVLGGLWRLASFGFNAWPHGDVVIDAAISESVAWHGRLLVPFVDVRYYPTERFGFGYPLDQHPPLWPLLGVPLTWLTGDGYTALKLVSLRHRDRADPADVRRAAALRRRGAGALCERAGGRVVPAGGLLRERVALGAAGGAVPGLAVGVADLRPQPPSPARGGELAWALLGVVMGLGYLTNYPAVVLPVALAVLHLVRHGRQAFRPATLAGPALSAVVLLLVIAPWLIYNATLFGGPFWSQPFQRTLAGGSRDVEYVLVDGEAVKRNLPARGDRVAALRERAVDLYGNVGFLAKQSLVLTPVLGGLFLVGLLLLVRGCPLTPARKRDPPPPCPGEREPSRDASAPLPRARGTDREVCGDPCRWRSWRWSTWR